MSFNLSDFNLTLGLTLGQIAKQLGGTLSGNAETQIIRVGSLALAQADAISFFNNTKYTTQLNNTSASAVIIKPDHAALTALPKIITDNPYAYFAKVSQLLNPVCVAIKGVHANAVIDSSTTVPASCSIAANVVIEANVKLGNNVIIGAGCVIERNCTLDDNTILEANVTIKHGTQIGKNCHLFSGCVIGNDGFGYAEETGADSNKYWVKIPQVGRVVIHDFVDIGANTSNYRMRAYATVVGDLNQVVQLNALFNHRIINRATVNGGVCANIYKIMNHDAAYLRNFYPVFIWISSCFFGITKTIVSNHTARK